MKFELLLVISILIAIAIISLFITICNVFITEKRTTLFSTIDLCYGMILGILACVTANSYIFMITMEILSLWFVIIGVKIKENQREMEQKEMEQKKMEQRNISRKNES